MRNRVLWSVPHVRFSLALPVLLLLIALTLAGCGGGGGGNNNNNNGNGNGNGGNNGVYVNGVFTPPASTNGLTTVSGQVQDFTTAPVVGATVTILGTGQSAQTDANGNFYIPNVPLTATRFSLTLPTGYTSNLGYYPGRMGIYTDQTCGGIHLPTLTAGNSPLGDVVFVFTPNSPAPPPSPQSPCS